MIPRDLWNAFADNPGGFNMYKCRIGIDFKDCIKPAPGHITEKQEDMIRQYEDFITKQSEAIIACDQRLKKVDDKGVFQADDEIGWMFKEILKIQEALNEFTIK